MKKNGVHTRTGPGCPPGKLLKNVDPNLFISENGVCQLSPFPNPPAFGSEGPTCRGGGGGSPSDSPPQPQFQCNLKKIFLRRLVFPMLFGPSDGPPHGGGGRTHKETKKAQHVSMASERAKCVPSQPKFQLKASPVHKTLCHTSKSP